MPRSTDNSGNSGAEAPRPEGARASRTEGVRRAKQHGGMDRRRKLQGISGRRRLRGSKRPNEGADVPDSQGPERVVPGVRRTKATLTTRDAAGRVHAEWCAQALDCGQESPAQLRARCAKTKPACVPRAGFPRPPTGSWRSRPGSAPRRQSPPRRSGRFRARAPAPPAIPPAGRGRRRLRQAW